MVDQRTGKFPSTRQPLLSLIGAVLVVAVGVAIGYGIATGPETAPSVPMDRQGTEKTLPAGPAQPDALPGKN